jgi:hypothetical protein
LSPNSTSRRALRANVKGLSKLAGEKSTARWHRSAGRFGFLKPIWQPEGLEKARN